MIKNLITSLLVFSAAMLLHKVSFAAEVINLPPEELAKESVLPVFRKNVTVRNRNVVTDGKVEIQAFYGYGMTEPIFNVSKFGFGGYYNISEDHALGVVFSQNLTGLSDYAKQLERQVPSIVNSFDAAYKPKSNILLDYNFKAFYGKLSVSKKMVINSLLYLSGGAGYAQYENAGYPMAAGGLGQKFYFTKDWALRFDLRLLAHQAPSPVNGNKERLHFFTVMDIGVSYLF